MDALTRRIADLPPPALALLDSRLRTFGAGVDDSIPPVARGQPIRMSFAQERLWFLNRLNPEDRSYHLAMTVDLPAAPDVRRLEAALCALAMRHETLRTTFDSLGGVPVQLIGEDPGVRLSVVYASARTWRSEMAAIASMPFDLQRGPLFRAALIHGPDRAPQLLLTMHHIISDGWSLGVIARDLQALYRGERLEPLAVQYADFSSWQRARLQGPALQSLIDYWRGQLDGASMLLDLPTDRARPRARDYRSGVVPVRIDPELVSRLEAIAESENATLFMAILAAFQALLHRVCGQDDVIVGTPVAGRTREAVEPLVGLFVNSLPLRGELGGDPTFREMLRRTRRATVDAYANQDLPFDRLVEELRPDRDLSHNPIFQVMFVWQNLPGAPAGRESSSATGAKFDLTLGLAPASDGGAAGGIEYAEDIFDEPTALELRRQLTTLLIGAATEPDRPLSEVALIDEAEREAIVARAGADTVPLDGTCLPERLARQAAATPERVAVEAGERKCTYAELEARTNRLARHLKAMGVGPDVRVAICLDRSIDSIVATRAVLQAGGAFVPLDPSYPPERLRYMLGDSGARVLVTLAALAPDPPGAGPAVVLLDRDRRRIATRSARPFKGPARPDNLAYVIYTSGSTGRPKGVMIPHRAIANHMAWMERSWPLGAADAVLHRTSASFDASIWEFLAPLLQGSRLVLASREAQRDPRALIADIVRHDVSVVQFVPSLLGAFLADEQHRQCHSLRLIYCGGEALPAELCQAVRAATGVDVVNLYGPTEATIDATAWTCRPDSQGRSPPIGLPITNLAAHVLDDKLEPCAVNVVGELYLSGAGLARGYLGQPGLTAERFIPNPFGPAGSRLYRTGDRVRRLRGGELGYVGRADQQVKLRGFRIELAEIEAVLAGHPAVAACAAAVREDSPGDQRLVAYVVPAEGRTPPPAPDLRRHALGFLPAFMVPNTIVALEALPTAPNGKLDRRALPPPPGGGPAVPPETELERRLLGIWEGVLKVGGIGREDNFFAVGGHSLLATQLASRIREELGADIPLRLIFEYPTIASLAVQIDAAGARQPAARIPRRPPSLASRAPLSFAQERLWFLDQLDPGNPTYNLTGAYVLEGAIDPVRLERSLATLIRRHESLRTTFDTDRGVPVQVIAPETNFRLATRSVGPEALSELSRAEALTRFDLREGPLFRATLARREPAGCTLLLNMHHIISDGWSMGVLLRELHALYRGDPLPPLEIQYADFACWQRSELSGERLGELLRYWRETLVDVPSLIALPTDRPRPATQSFRGDAVKAGIPAGLTARLEELAQREGATLFMILLAGFQAVLQRYCQQDSVLVGSPIANRTRGETEPLIGFFVNTLVFRADFAGDPTVIELLRQSRDRALGAYEHQDLPFEKLVEELNPVRSLGHHPLFQVMFAMQNTPGAEVDPGAVYESRAAKFDLTLVLAHAHDGSLAGSIEYDSAIFDEDSVARLALHLETWLDNAARDPARRVSEVSLVSEAERAEVVTRWNDTAAPYEESLLHLLIARQSARTPAAVALEDGAREVSYAELSSASARLARRLAAAGVGRGDRVGLYIGRSADMVTAILAVLEAGAAYVPLDPNYPDSRIAFMTEDADVSLVLSESRLAASIPALAVPVVHLDEPGPSKPVRRADRAHPDDLAYVIYTSGSTGRPKGVMVTHRGLCNLVASQKRSFGLGPGRRVLQFASLSFDISVWEMTLALATGATLCIPRAHELVPGEALQAFIRDRGVDTITLLPSVLDSLDPEDLPKVELVVSGAEACGAETARRWAADGKRRFFNGYGPTETTVWATAAREDGSRRPPIGWPIGETRVYVLDDRWEPTGIGIPGELVIAGAGVARGYHGRPDLTAERFVPDPFGPPGSRMYRSGDRVRRLVDGSLDFLGRVDEQIKLRGFRIEPAEIEAALRSLPGVEEAAAVLRPLGAEMALVGYFVGEGADSDLRRRLSGLLPEHMIPTHFVSLERLPRMPNGKIDRNALPAPSAEPGTGPGALPKTATEARLLLLWRELLGIDGLHAESDFFLSGGHSLLATRMVSGVRTLFGVDLPVRAVFEAPVLSALAGRIDSAPRHPTADAIPKRPPEKAAAAPMSCAQERLWFLDRLDQGGAAYIMVSVLRGAGRLDAFRLERAATELMGRHEILRTRFDQVDGVAVQIVEPEPSAHFRVAAAAEGLAAIVSSEALDPFDLRAGPPIRFTLVRSADAADDRLVIAMHHIVSDGWSMDILRRDLLALYAGEPLPPLPIQYADYATWEQGLLQGERLEALLRFWRDALREAPTVLQLPLDHPRPARQSHRGAAVPLTLRPDLASRLERLAQREGATVFMVLVAAIQTLLHRYSGQRTVLLGIPVANRTRREVEPLIGFFVNTLVLRGDFDEALTVPALIRKTRDRTLEALAHQSLPFERLVEDLQPERSLAHNPLFQVMFAWQNMAGHGPDPAGAASPSTAKFDLTIELAPAQDGGVQGSLIYATDLFDHSTIERMAKHLRTLLESFAEAGDVPVPRLALMDPEERLKVIEGWNSTAAPPEAGCAADPLAEHARARPQAPCLDDGRRCASYAQVEAESNRWARALVRHGIGPGSRVGIYLDRSIEMVVALLATMKSGGAYVPLDPSYPAERIDFMMRDGQVSAVFTSTALRRSLPRSAGLVIPMDTGAADSESTDPLPRGPAPDDLAYVIYTSGSTGQPKGVMVTHRGLCNMIECQRRTFALSPSDRVLQFSSLSFDISIWDILLAIGSGAALRLASREELMPGAPLQDLLERARVTVVTLLPSVLGSLDATRLPHIQTVISGAEPCPMAVARQWSGERRRFFNGYGPTETTVWATVAEETGRRRPPIGWPIGGFRAYVLEPTLEPVPIGLPGELYLAGVGIARGYLNNPALTAERFLPDPFGPAASRMYRTGDRVRRLADGSLDFLGRMDDQVKVRGFRIEPGEIETALTRVDGVKEAVVVVHGESEHARLVAYYTGERDVDPGMPLHSMLPGHMIPGAFIWLAEIPRMPNGKVDRAALPSPSSRAASRPERPPADRIEEGIARIWRSLLHIEAVGADDNFFDLGGHSLLAARLIGRLRDEFGVDLALKSLFEAPTVAGLAAIVGPLADCSGEDGGGAGSRIAPRPFEQRFRAPPSYSQERLWFLDRLHGSSPIYNVVSALEIGGFVDASRLQRAVDTLVERHEALRTTFVAEGGTPVQIIAPSLKVSVRQAWAGGTGLDRFVRSEAAEPFDLAEGPLFRVILVHGTAGNRSAVLVALHHIVTDGWSMDILMKELRALYQGEPLAPPRLQYADYSVWQRALLDDRRLAELRDYWSAELAGLPKVLDIAAAKPRPAVPSHQGSVVPVRVDEPLAAQLDDLGRREGLTRFMLLLAAYQILLHRYSRQDVVAVGTPVANRPHPDLENVMGFFANTVVMRADFAPELAIGEFLRRTRERTLSAYDHQELPFEKLVEELRPDRALDHHPLFQAMIVWQNMPGAEAGPALTGAGTTAKFDLLLALAPTPDGAIAGELEFSTDLFEIGSARRMASHFVNILRGLLADPETPLGEIGLADEGELAELIAAPPSTALETEPLGSILARRALADPDSVAVEFGPDEVTYRALAERTRRLSGRLLRAGLAPGAPIGICIDRSVEMIVATLASLEAGLTYVPLDPGYPAERLAFMIEDARVAAILVDEGTAGRLPATARLIRVSKDDASDGDAPLPKGSRAARGAPGYIIYTSGSTGWPKGIRMNAAALENLVAWQRRQPAGQSPMRTLQFASLSFDVSFQEIVSTLSAGGTLVLIGEDRRRDPAELWKLIAERSIERIFLPFVALQQLAQAAGRPEGAIALRHVITAGEQLQMTPQIIDFLKLTGATLHNQYGPSETHVATQWVLGHDPESAPSLPPIGRPIANVTAYVLDRSMRPSAFGVPGELYIGGICLADGYVDRPALTAEKFVPDPWGEGRLYRTGDSAVRLENGELRFLGRLDGQLKIRGYRIEPGEVESTLTRFPGIREAAVTVAEAGPEDRRLVAYLVAEPGTAPAPPDILAFARRTLPAHMIPSAVAILSELPLTPSGKLDRRRLPEPEWACAPLPGQVAPRTGLEREIAGIWREMLGVGSIGVEDNFFAGGGHSLLATRLVSRVRQALGVDVPLRQFFEHPTVEGLARSVVLARLESVSSEIVEQLLDEVEGLPPSLSPREVPA